MTKVKWVCENCGSDDVCCDATARWNVEKQEWVLTDLMDGDFCGGCDEEVRLIAVEITGETA